MDPVLFEERRVVLVTHCLRSETCGYAFQRVTWLKAASAQEDPLLRDSDVASGGHVR